jgi:hypothetical protein
MPYIILLVGLILAVSGLYRFFLKAEPRQIKALFQAIAAAGIGIAALFLALTGRLPIAVAILTALWPIGLSYYRNRRLGSDSSTPLNEKEAYEVLGLEQGATHAEIHEAHIRLMKKVHPDQSGSDWLAKKINAARDLLMSRNTV